MRMVAWEVTRSCNLNCIHCRAAAERGPYPGELSTEECLRLIDGIVSFSTPVVILTGGEPLLREDIYDLARYGTSRGLRMVIAPNGTLVDAEKAARLVQDAMFSRKPDAPTCFFVGGSNVKEANKVADVIKKSLFEPFLHPVVVDPRGSLRLRAPGQASP